MGNARKHKKDETGVWTLAHYIKMFKTHGHGLPSEYVDASNWIPMGV